MKEEITDWTDDEQLDDIAEKYLTFSLGEVVYGIEIMRVHEIIQQQKITSMPNADGYIRGVINLRGEVILVMDLRCKLGLSQKEDTAKTCIIIAETHATDGTEATVGLVIDEVKDVLDIPSECIEPPNAFCSQAGRGYIRGIGKVEEGVRLLLDLDSVVAGVELAAVS